MNVIYFMGPEKLIPAIIIIDYIRGGIWAILLILLRNIPIDLEIIAYCW